MLFRSGGRGINSGYLDVMNLAWKLDFVLRGNADTNLLGSYSDERRTSILQTIEELTGVTIYMTTPSPAVALMRDATLSLSLTEPFVRALFDPFRVPLYASLRVAATASAKASELDFDGGPALGQVVPDIPISAPSGSGAARLLDLCGDKFQCLVWGGTPGADEMLDRLCRELEQRRLPVRCVAINAGRVPANALAVTSAAAADVFDARPGTVYLLRPDHHVGGRWKNVDASEIIGSLTHVLGREQHSQRSKVH